jgi:protein-tyrosine phosphatase
LRVCGVDALVCLLTKEEVTELGLTEEAACGAACGVQFVSFPIPDRCTPSSGQGTLQVVRALADLLAEGKAVAVHCRQGVGRSALLAGCILAALGAQPADAFNRIAQARGRPVPDTVEQRDWVGKFAARYLNDGGRPPA